jgi:hypothetical protein
VFGGTLGQLRANGFVDLLEPTSKLTSIVTPALPGAGVFERRFRLRQWVQHEKIRATKRHKSIGRGVTPDLLRQLTELQNLDSRSALPKLNDPPRAAKDFGASGMQEYSAYIIGPKGRITRRIDPLCANAHLTDTPRPSQGNKRCRRLRPLTSAPKCWPL